MAGPNLEVFKFGLYLFVPIVALLHFGDPKWYHNHVLPYKDHLFPPMERTNARIPTDQIAVREELARIKAEKLARRVERERLQSIQDQDAAPQAQGQSTGWFKSWW
ncbi:hypothetical protein SERLA73DRAFT_175553 [Serpula lacrymans var. lacrymans S7.3]|uniref:Uncharacterized protein n=2 Tax=Serpula lacrymans var. lacrymans TaxID=341189 RepID=F8PKF3_SERL3|nr:uncharacterized protein SERLADRAFT_458066 [Serpula lacrymans var. lacrymans S7.9]EGO03867.1 hypothetical protein SERLA73DRAFT_175553 [Serpula lacrymans var. lacrymans S7.3]EGO29794.1 hypothetical protein SERLADRAFT_458066 [Serpula lacrymans var. lacrymans S7.9]